MVIINKRQEQKALTKKNILHKTKILLAQEGFVKLSTKQVANAAKVSQGTIFLHFNTKDNLLHQIIEEIIGKFEKDLKESCDIKLDEDSFVKQFINVHIKHETLIARIHMDYPYLSEILQREFKNMETMIKNLIFDHLRYNKKNQISIVDTFIRIDAFYAQIVKYFLEKEVFSKSNSIIKNRKGKIVKLHKIIFHQ